MLRSRYFCNLDNNLKKKKNYFEYMFLTGIEVKGESLFPSGLEEKCVFSK